MRHDKEERWIDQTVLDALGEGGERRERVLGPLAGPTSGRLGFIRMLADDVAVDAMDAQNYLISFYLAAWRCLEALRAAEEAAVESFAGVTEDDPPELETAVVVGVLGTCFSGVDGWERIEKGIARESYAVDLSRLRVRRQVTVEAVAGAAVRGPSGTGQDDLDARDEHQPGGIDDERADTSDPMTERVGLEVGCDVGLLESSGADDGSALSAAGRRLDTLGRWSDAGVALLEEEAAALDRLFAARDDLALRCQLTGITRAALGHIPDVAGVLGRVVEAATACELHLYQVRFGPDSGAHLVIWTGESPHVIETAVRGGGWRDAVATRIRELRPELETDAALAGFLGLPTESVVSGRGESGGPVRAEAAARGLSETSG